MSFLFRRTGPRSGEEFHVRRDEVAGPHAYDVPGDQFPGGMTCRLESCRTRALTCNRFGRASTTPAARRSYMKLNTALITRRAPTTARSEYFLSTDDNTMINSSIHAEIPQIFRKHLGTGCPFYLGHFVVAVLL